MKKKEIFKMIDTFGLTVVLDRWDEGCYSGFIRIKDSQHEEAGHLILYKNSFDLESDKKRDLQIRLKWFLIDIGKYKLKKELNNLLSIHTK